MLGFQAFVENLVQKLLGHRHHHSIISKNDAGDTDNGDDNDDDDDDDLVRDAFSLHKMIIAVTAAGKVSFW